ncbi:MAG TPA: alkaline phosphatase family protein [Streptosporangiaceae bacterium]|nr:alkaline phosphatase family protein [Streptosporangiaceae bacterium]
MNGLGPGTTSPMSLDVGSGSYAFRCLFDDYDPLDEQTFLVNTINQIEESKYWASTAIVITYDDSDGWYDHQASVTKFIEDNWLGGRQLPNGSYDAISGRLDAPGGVLDFHTRPHFRPLILNPTTGRS